MIIRKVRAAHRARALLKASGRRHNLPKEMHIAVLSRAREWGEPMTRVIGSTQWVHLSHRACSQLRLFSAKGDGLGYT